MIEPLRAPVKLHYLAGQNCLRIVPAGIDHAQFAVSPPSRSPCAILLWLETH
jgi:hypothetical protein